MRSKRSDNDLRSHCGKRRPAAAPVRTEYEQGRKDHIDGIAGEGAPQGCSCVSQPPVHSLYAVLSAVRMFPVSYSVFQYYPPINTASTVSASLNVLRVSDFQCCASAARQLPL